MKKLLTAILSVSLLSAAVLPAQAVQAAGTEPPASAASGPAAEEDAWAGGYAIEIDGEIIGARACVMVPLRAVAEKLGFTVTWDGGAVTVTGRERYVNFTVGRDEYFAAPTEAGLVGASLFSLGCAPCVVDGATYVPVELFDALLGCGEGTVVLEGSAVKIHSDPEGAENVQIPNPFSECASLDEAAAAAGFGMTVPDRAGGSGSRAFRAIKGGLLEVLYFDGKEVAARIRKAPGSGDISGDYNVCGQTKTVDVDGRTVTMKGEDGLFSLALWTGGGYTYAVSVCAGMTDGDMAALVRQVK